MKKTYTKKQITEAIAYWKKQLEETMSSENFEYDDMEMKYAVIYKAGKYDKYLKIAEFQEIDDAKLFMKSFMNMINRKYRSNDDDIDIEVVSL